MRLTVLNSNSKGNAYILSNGEEKLMIECGLTYSAIQKGLNFNLKGLVGILVSHEHKDHAKSAKKLSKDGWNVYCSKGTAIALGIKPKIECKHLKKIKIGNFTVLPFNLTHDSVEPMGFLISHRDCGNVLFATDTGEIPYNFEGINNMIIECNHSTSLIEEKVREGIATEVATIRPMRNHLSLEECVKFLDRTDLSLVNNIVLIHLSERHADPIMFREAIKKVAPFCKVQVATPNLEIQFDKAPF